MIVEDIKLTLFWGVLFSILAAINGLLLEHYPLLICFLLIAHYLNISSIILHQKLIKNNSLPLKIYFCFLIPIVLLSFVPVFGYFSMPLFIFPQLFYFIKFRQPIDKLKLNLTPKIYLALSVFMLMVFCYMFLGAYFL